MSQLKRLAEIVSRMEGQVVNKHLAGLAKDLSTHGHLESGIHSSVMDMMKNQILILMLKDLGGVKSYSVEEVDENTTDYVLKMSLNERVFTFTLEKKTGVG